MSGVLPIGRGASWGGHQKELGSVSAVILVWSKARLAVLLLSSLPHLRDLPYLLPCNYPLAKGEPTWGGSLSLDPKGLCPKSLAS